MKIVNKTNWNTKDLRKLCSRVLKKCGASPNTRIYIKTSRRLYSGRAGVGVNWIHMFVPTTTQIRVNTIYSETKKTIGTDGKEYPAIERFDKIQEPRTFDVKIFAQVLEHEIGHNLGLRSHRDMVSHASLNVDYVKDLVIRPKEGKKKVRDLKAERYKKALAKVKELKTKLKRNQTLLKKWQKKVKYYERQGVKRNDKNR